jgi:hypothetical protein
MAVDAAVAARWERVSRGVIRLHQRAPGWWWPGVIDLERIRIGDRRWCVVVQAAARLELPGDPAPDDPYTAALRRVCVPLEQAADFGFGAIDAADAEDLGRRWAVWILNLRLEDRPPSIT